MKIQTANNTHTIVEERTQRLNEIERIEKLPRTQKWRAMKELMLKMKPELEATDKGVCEAMREKREIDNLKSTGASKSGDMRHSLSLPEYLYLSIKAIEPDFMNFDIMTKAEARAETKKVWETFPEYRGCRLF